MQSYLLLVARDMAEDREEPERPGEGLRPEWSAQLAEKIWLHGVTREDIGREIRKSSSTVGKILNGKYPDGRLLKKYKAEIIAAAEKLCAKRKERT